MKFKFDKLSSTKGRRGKLFDFAKYSDKVFETPLLLLYTKGGSIPHITHEVLQWVSTDQHVLQVPLPSTILAHEAVKNFKKGITSFSGLSGHLSYCTLQDPAQYSKKGYNRKTVVSVWSPRGRMSVDAKKYMEIMESFQPDLYQAAFNCDLNEDSGSKVLYSSKVLFETCLKKHQESEVLKNSGIIAVVNIRSESNAKYIANQPVDGFAIENLIDNPEDENYNSSKLMDNFDTAMKLLPEDKIKFISGQWQPQHLLNMIYSGADVFDSSLPYSLTEKRRALVFSYCTIPFTTTEPTKDVVLDISLANENYKDDFGPVVEGCKCLTCVKHTKAYIHHLIENKELLAYTLLMIHNIHHYMEFFKFIRTSMEKNEKVIIT